MSLQDNLNRYTDERGVMQAQLLDLTDRLSRAKWGKRGGLKKAIRKLKKPMRKLERLIKETQNELRKVEKIEVKEILATQGIDSSSNQIEAIGGVVGQVGSVVGNFIGSSAIGGRNSSGTNDILPRPSMKTTQDESPNYMLYGGLGIAVLGGLYLMTKNK